MIQKTHNSQAFQDAIAALVKAFDLAEKEPYSKIGLTISRENGAFHAIEWSVTSRKHIKSKAKQLTGSAEVVTMN